MTDLSASLTSLHHAYRIRCLQLRAVLLVDCIALQQGAAAEMRLNSCGLQHVQTYRLLYLLQTSANLHQAPSNAATRRRKSAQT